MKYLKIEFLILLIFFCTSCIKNEGNSKINNLDKNDSIQIDDKKEISNIGETLLPESKKKVGNWYEYQQLDQLLTNFYSISPNEALNLSQELSTTTKQLKDSLKIERFKEPDVLVRLNVLHNSALRLSDMSTIPNIDVNDVKAETKKILNAYSALNAKINNITRQEKLEIELKGFEKN